MAVYYLKFEDYDRKSRSILDKAAYRSGTTLHSDLDNKDFDYTRRKDVIKCDILLPPNAPPEYRDRQVLWNAVDAVEKNKNACLAREVRIALPKELDHELQDQILRAYIIENFVDIGMIADYAIHDKGDGNPHTHILLTTRPLDEKGHWMAKERKVYRLDENGEKIPIIDPETGKQKRRADGTRLWERQKIVRNEWRLPGLYEKWRSSWAEHCNRYLEPELRIDHRSYERQGVHKEAQMQTESPRGDKDCPSRKFRLEWNKRIKALNSRVESTELEVSELKCEMKETFIEIQRQHERIGERWERAFRDSEAFKRDLRAERTAQDAVDYNRNAGSFDSRIEREAERGRTDDWGTDSTAVVLERSERFLDRAGLRMAAFGDELGETERFIARSTEDLGRATESGTRIQAEIGGSIQLAFKYHQAFAESEQKAGKAEQEIEALERELGDGAFGVEELERELGSEAERGEEPERESMERVQRDGEQDGGTRQFTGLVYAEERAAGDAGERIAGYQRKLDEAEQRTDGADQRVNKMREALDACEVFLRQVRTQLKERLAEKELEQKIRRSMTPDQKFFEELMGGSKGKFDYAKWRVAQMKEAKQKAPRNEQRHRREEIER